MGQDFLYVPFVRTRLQHQSCHYSTKKDIAIPDENSQQVIVDIGETVIVGAVLDREGSKSVLENRPILTSYRASTT
jgi:hypothetical protein